MPIKTTAERRPLKRILGTAFGIAVMVGGIIGVGILRSPGSVAALMDSKALIMLAWTLGGVYIILGVNALAELATMLPKAGGPFNYIQRAFGNYPGFISGWFDFIVNTVAAAYFCIAIGEYISLLLPALKGNETAMAASLLIGFTLLHAAGLKGGSLTQQLTSLIKLVAFVILIVACFLYGGEPGQQEINEATSTAISAGIFIAFIRSLQLIMGTYDGWGAPVFFAEENVDPGKTIPRSLFGGAALVIFVYLLINLAVFYVLPLHEVAGSKLAMASVAGVIFGQTGFTIITLIAIFSLLSILNAQMMICPRILYGLSRQGFFIEKGTLVNRGGTPWIVLLFTSLVGLILVIFSSFESLFALGTFMNLVVSILMFSALVYLRRTEPNLPRPYKAFGYPWTIFLMIAVALTLFISYAIADTPSFIIIAAFILISFPAYKFFVKRR